MPDVFTCPICNKAFKWDWCKDVLTGCEIKTFDDAGYQVYLNLCPKDGGVVAAFIADGERGGYGAQLYVPVKEE